jgi:ABC-2 type transport system permease protein
MLISFLSLFAVLIPIYFVTQALDPVMRNSIRGEGSQYFAFVLMGMIVMRFCYSVVDSLPAAFITAIRFGTLEAFFATPTSLRAIVAGMLGFNLLWTGAEAAVLLVTGVLLGVRIVPEHLFIALLVLGLILLTYLSFGIVGVALVLLFRTTGSVLGGVLVATNFLGGVYYPTHVIPSHIQAVSVVLPMTYGLRALRRLLLEGAPVQAASADIAVLGAFLVILLPASWGMLHLSLRHARRTGTLAQY